MPRHLRAVFVALCLVLLVWGCKKETTDESASNPPPDNTAATGAAPDAGKKAGGVLSAFSSTITVPEGTPIEVVLDQAVGSKISQSGEKFDATVARAVEVDGKVAIPKGARARGLVKEAQPAGRFKGGARLALTLDSLTIDGKTHEIRTSAPTMATKGKGKRSAEMIGGGAAAGAIIGAIAGGGKGAAIGAAVGGGAGTGGAAFTGNRDIKLDPETRLTFKLSRPLEIKK